jgi:hypothetical protein
MKFLKTVKAKIIGAIIAFGILAITLFGCATLTIGPDATPDEKMRAGISDAINTVDVILITAKTYAVIRPERLTDYKNKSL